jgi:hypothetical protein
MATFPPPYFYFPIYGADLWTPNGPQSDSPTGSPVVPDGSYGGAIKTTNDNLLISLWTITDDEGGIPTEGALLKPFSAANFPPIGIEGVGEPGALPLFSSRTTCRFELFVSDDPPFTYPILAILRPPQDLKTRLQNAVTLSLGGGPLGFSGRFNKPIVLEDSFWDVKFDERGDGGAVAPSTGIWLPGTPLPGLLLGGTFLPYTKTDGSDGTYPQFFDTSGPASVIPIQEALNTGNYFVPMLIAPGGSLEGISRVTISSPHTAARGR